MTFKFIDSAKEEFPVCRLCKMMNVSSSGYLAHKKRPMSAYQRKNNALLAHIRAIFSQTYQSYGSPRMTKELQAKGFAVGRRRIA